MNLRTQKTQSYIFQFEDLKAYKNSNTMNEILIQETFWKGYGRGLSLNLTGRHRKFFHTVHFLTRGGRRLLRQKRQKEARKPHNRILRNPYFNVLLKRSDVSIDLAGHYCCT